MQLSCQGYGCADRMLHLFSGQLGLLVTIASSVAEGGYLRHVLSLVYVLVHHPCGVLRGSTLSSFFSFNPRHRPWFGLSVHLGLKSLPLQRPSQVRVHVQLILGWYYSYMYDYILKCVFRIDQITQKAGDVCGFFHIKQFGLSFVKSIFQIYMRSEVHRVRESVIYRDFRI